MLLICLFLTENRGAVFDLSLFVLQNINLSINRDEMLKKMNSDNEIIDINQFVKNKLKLNSVIWLNFIQKHGLIMLENLA